MDLKKDVTTNLKAVAIIMVLISHLHKVTVLPHAIEPLLNPCGYLGVAIFLFLSGYGCFASNSKNNESTLVKRIVRVMIPLSVCTILTAALTTIVPPH